LPLDTILKICYKKWKLEGKMAEMALGYGSEFQLLRFLGHHRQELEGIILKNTKINPNLEYNMEWLDFPKDNKRKSLDGEYVGIDFLDKKSKSQIAGNWKKYWPQSGSVQNWDAVLYLSPIVPDTSIKDKWVLIEAKGTIKEGIEDGTGAKDKESIKTIENAFEETKKRFNIKTQNNWLKKYYQLANRLAFINFLLDNNIDCSLLYIYFINAWPNNSQKNILTKDTWKKVINDEYAYLGINNEAKKHIYEIFVEC
jgi:hypothetical protein